MEMSYKELLERISKSSEASEGFIVPDNFLKYIEKKTIHHKSDNSFEENASRSQPPSMIDAFSKYISI